MLDRIHKTALAVSEKTGATISVEFNTGALDHINIAIYPAGWHEARSKADSKTATQAEWELSKSAKHYNGITANSEGCAQVMEILEALL